jgi:hypothetical protein
MFRSLVVVLIGSAIATVPVSPDDVRAHRVRMISTQILEQQIEDALSMESRGDAAAAARELLPILSQERDYWDRANVEDALVIAVRHYQTAERLSEEASRGDLAGAHRTLESLRTTCVACHGRFPESRVIVGR